MQIPADCNVADYFLFDRLKEGRADHVAIRFGDRRYTYGEVASRADGFARWLMSVGLHPEDRVAVILPDMPPFAWGMFGLLRAAGILCMGNPQAPALDLAYMVAYVKATVVITTPAVAAGLDQADVGLPHCKYVCVVPDCATDDDPEAACAWGAPSGMLADAQVVALVDAVAHGQALAHKVPLPTLHRDDPCIWLFTSGSTGRPKAAMHTHRDFVFNTEVYAKACVGYQPSDVTVSVPRLFFGYATGTNLWFPFAVGATACLFTERPTAESVAAAVARYRPTIVTNVPTMIGKLLELDEAMRARGEPGLDFSSVRFHLSAGEALPEALLNRFLERFGAPVFDGIGSAEMFHIYCSNRPGEVKPGSLGKVVAGYELRVLPQDATEPGAPPLPPGEIGVLWVKGDSVAQGYFQDRDKSWQTFHGHWCRTGDLFHIDAEGYLYIAGRADDLLKVGGVFVAPLEVEECLLGHRAVSACAVIAGKEGDLVKPKAVVCLRAEGLAMLRAGDRDALVADIKAHVQTKLSKHKYPRWVVFVDDLPKNDRGKIDRKLLAALADRGQLVEL